MAGTLLIPLQAALVYPTTPNAGYHMRHRRGFEGWYHRLSLPDVGESFAFIYAVFDASYAVSPRHGASAQLVGPSDECVWQQGSAAPFIASERALALSHAFSGVSFRRPPRSPAAYERFCTSGFALSATRHQGVIRSGTEVVARWAYDVAPQYGWGGTDGAKQYSTTGWLAALPVFEPHYQVLMAHGEASGFVEWRGARREFTAAPVYAEKNWGGAFPRRWFWMQCNAFDEGRLSVTCACAERADPLLDPLLGGASGDSGAKLRVAALAAVHTPSGEFLPFADLRWEVGEWGEWRVDAEADEARLRIDASADDAGARLRCPTQRGMEADLSRETLRGQMRLRLWRRRVNGEFELEIDTRSDLAALEVGGGDAAWRSGWRGEVKIPSSARAVLAADVPLGLVPREWIPGY